MPTRLATLAVLGALLARPDLASAQTSEECPNDDVAAAGTVDSGVAVPTATWVFFAVGAGSAALVGVFGGLTLDALSTFKEEPSADREDVFYALRTSTNVAIGVTGAALLTGAIIWVVDAAISKRAARERTASSPPWATVVTW